ncbi:hypothetical protein N7478_009469 [Penicillium angulare]|uniref:uncharacterized protein n=1 Tax=Penicillium angulare TaxID=116970 RepID=UPI00253F8C9A|nr:uncharacterized protein N7478_009469 [Penicillium angulare]KAJ5266661.1 hypothetical protein N7478_009469 [Penicillium angulare]
MQFKDSILLLTALSLGAVARPHGHERRHAHPQINEIADKVVEEAPAVTAPAQVAEKVVDGLNQRDVGDEVYATINGVLVSWINEWAGGVDSTTSTTSTSSSSTSIYVPPTTTTAEPTTSTSAPAVESSVSATPASSSGGSWTSYPSDGDFSTSGFGATNYIAEALGIEWSGNTGLPWGSNIQQVSESDASQYRNVIRFEGSNTDDWTVIFWNKMGPNKQMTGFFSPNKALSFTLAPNEVAYVAIDDESTGGWTAYQGDDCPLSEYGSYAATWGEFTMRKAPNFSSWDVSCIQAQNAEKDIQGMSICTHDGSQCSSITKNMGKVTNAYTSAETDINGIGGNLKDEAVRLVVNLDYA